MSDETVEIVQQIYSRWERGSFFETPHFFDPDIHVVWIDPLLAAEGETRGLEDLVATMRTFLEQWEDLRVTPQRFLATGDDVVCLAVWQARGRVSGVPVEHPQANVWTFVDGKATRLVNYGDHAKGLEAAGL